MTAVPLSTNSLSRPGQLQSLSRRLAPSIFDGLAGAPALRVPAGSTYSGPLLRVRRSSDNAEQNFGAVLTPDASGNRWLDSEALLAFVRPTITSAAFLLTTDTTFTAVGIGSLTAQISGGAVDVTKPFQATNAVYPITSNQSYWYAALDGIYTKAVLIQFTFGAGTIGIRAVQARWTNGNALAQVANAGTWNLSTVATSGTMAGYGARDLAFTNLSGQGFVTTWFDQSGNGNHATQTTTTRQPRIVNNGLLDLENSRPAVYFENNWLFSGAVPSLLAAPVTVIQVVRWVTLSGYRSSAGIGNSAATANGIDIGAGGTGSNLYVGAANIAGTTGNTIPTNAAILVTASHSGTATSGRINGVDSPGSALTFAYNGAGGNITIGSSRASVTTSAGGGAFRVLETIVVQGILSPTQRQRLEANLAAAFGITIT